MNKNRCKEKPPLRGGNRSLFQFASPCKDSCMKLFTAPIALISIFALSACGGDAETNASVERAAASSQTYTLCVKNDSSRSISSRGDGSARSPEGFLVGPGESACTSASPGAGRINQEMMSDTGPSWAMSYETNEINEGDLTKLSRDFSLCGRTWSNVSTITSSLSCSGNAFRVNVNFKSNGAGPTANVTFADQ